MKKTSCRKHNSAVQIQPAKLQLATSIATQHQIFVRCDPDSPASNLQTRIMFHVLFNIWLWRLISISFIPLRLNEPWLRHSLIDTPWRTSCLPTNSKKKSHCLPGLEFLSAFIKLQMMFETHAIQLSYQVNRCVAVEMEKLADVPTFLPRL